MKIFTCGDHDGVWLGGASVVVAEDEESARALLSAELISQRLKGDQFSLQELKVDKPHVVVLWNGDY